MGKMSGAARMDEVQNLLGVDPHTCRHLPTQRQACAAATQECLDTSPEVATGRQKASVWPHCLGKNRMRKYDGLKFAPPGINPRQCGDDSGANARRTFQEYCLRQATGITSPHRETMKAIGNCPHLTTKLEAQQSSQQPLAPALALRRAGTGLSRTWKLLSAMASSTASPTASTSTSSPRNNTHGSCNKCAPTNRSRHSTHTHTHETV